MDYPLRKSDSDDVDGTESSTTFTNCSDSETSSVHSSSATGSKTKDGNGTRTNAIQKVASLPSLGGGIRKKRKAKRKGNIRKASSWPSSGSGTFKKTTHRRSSTNNRDSYSLMSRLRAELQSTEVECFGELTDDMSDELSFLL